MMRVLTRQDRRVSVRCAEYGPYSGACQMTQGLPSPNLHGFATCGRGAALWQLLGGEIDRPNFIDHASRLGVERTAARLVADKFLANHRKSSGASVQLRASL